MTPFEIQQRRPSDVQVCRQLDRGKKGDGSKNMIELAKLTEEAFSASVVLDEKEIIIRFAGTADFSAKKHLGTLFGEVHDRAMALGVTQVQLDLRDLAFMSSSCLKDVIVWLEKVRQAEDLKRYLVAFVSSKTQPWQRRSLHALSVFAHGMVTVEVC